MSIKEVMKLGTAGMNTAQKQEEKERRIKVAETITKLGGQLAENKAAKNEKKVRELTRKLNRIKADESVWLKEAAWFMYC